MTPNRMFYIGLGCLISTLCWTIFMIARDQQNRSHLEVDTLTCKELRVLDKDNKVGIRMYDRPYGDGGGSVLQMSVLDNRILKDGKPSQGQLRITSRGLSIYNWQGTRIATMHVEKGNGSLSLNKRDRDRKSQFIIDTETGRYSKSHCPCQLQQ